MCASSPKRVSSARSLTGSSGSFPVFSCSARLVRLSTRTSPLRSRMSPRGAITLYSRVRLFFASARYLSPSRTCRFQSRKKRTAKRATAMPPITATRSERRLPWGRESLRRYTVLGSQHRRTPAAAAQRALVDQGRAQRPPHPDVDRPAADEGEDALQQDVPDYEGADRRVEAEHHLHRAEAELGEQGQAHAEQRRHQRAVDLEALAEGAGQVADGEEDEGAAAERHDQQAVEQEPDPEPADGAGQRAAEQSEHDYQSRQQIRADAEQGHLREERELEDHAADDDRDEPGEDVRGEDHPREPPVRTWTTSRSRRSAKGRMWTCDWASCSSNEASTTSPIGRFGG